MPEHKDHRRSTTDRYRLKLASSLEYIEKNITRRLSLEDIAGASHLSPYHFHRVFRELMGETVNDYVARKRLEYAANYLLCSTNTSITEVATSLGYSSAANFAKAFKQYYGISPTELRQPEQINRESTGKLSTKYDKAFDPHELHQYSESELTPLESQYFDACLDSMTFVEQEDLPIAYLTSSQGYDLDTITENWRKITAFGMSQDIPGSKQRLIGISHDNPMLTPADRCRYDTAILIPADLTVTPPYLKTVIPAGRYAIFHYQGPSSAALDLHTYLYTRWLPDNGFEAAHAPINEYLDGPPRGSDLNVRIYIKLRPLQGVA